MTKLENDFLIELTVNHNDMDFIANNGYQFSKEDLIKIIKELFYTAYDKMSTKEYRDFINSFVENMKEYEDFFLDN